MTVLVTMLGMDITGSMTWIIYITGGILGVILVSVLFDWALITLSSLAGASMVIQAFSPQRTIGGLLFFILVFAGVIIQGAILRREKTIVAAE